MKAFVNEGLSRASMLPGVGSEIKAFMDAEKALREQHGDTMSPYHKALWLPGHKRLAPVNFPNLCKVENTRKRRIDRTFHDYKSTKESLLSLTDREAEDAVAQPPMKKKMVSSADADRLKSVFRATDQEINKATNSVQGNVPVSLEAALLTLTEALRRN